MVENRGAALTTWQDWATDGRSIVPGAADLARERSPWRFPPAFRSPGLVRARLQGRGCTPRVRGGGRLAGDPDAKHGNLGRDQHRYRRVPAHACGRPGRRHARSVHAARHRSRAPRGDGHRGAVSARTEDQCPGNHANPRFATAAALAAAGSRPGLTGADRGPARPARRTDLRGASVCP